MGNCERDESPALDYVPRGFCSKERNLMASAFERLASVKQWESAPPVI